MTVTRKPMSEVPLILCVDDQQANLEIRVLLLRQFGCEVLTANDHASALQILAVNPVDLMFVDFHLAPGTTGEEIADDIRLLRPEVRLVMLTGDPRVPETVQRKFDAVLIKGTCNPGDLWQIIQGMVPQKKLLPRRASLPYVAPRKAG